MSDIYQYLGSKERFRALAYSKASRIIGSLPEDISGYLKNDTLEEIPGVGESIAEKIREFIRTGKISKYEQLKKSVPFELMDLLEVKGFGPRSLSRIHEELKITSKEKLIAALQNGSIAKLKGFGPKKAEQMLRGLKIHKTIEERMFLWDALESGERVLDYLRNLPETVQAELAGSLRRRKETIGDIDVLVTCEEKNRKKIVSHFINAHFARQVLAKGETKASILLKESGRQVDLRIVKPDEWGAALQYFTGSKEHNIHLRTIARDKGYKISEYGVFRLKNEEKVAGLTEAEIYKTLGLQIIPPEMREDRGELELAAKNKIPRLVSPDDIKGDLQMHSTWSDGVCSLEELVSFVKKNFSYDYMVITDHSKSSRIAKGMDEKQLAKQIKAIDRLNAKTGGSFLKKGIEVDILPNGRLDIGNDLLQQLDWVTASIHNGFNKDATDRLLAACEHPFVNCIGHPTGRLIGSREPYDFDFDQLVKAAKRTHTALEINAQPDRMDLNDEMAFRARKEGIPLVISTDSHAPGNFHFMILGVYIARRAWCTSKDILNTGSWKSIDQFRQQKTRI